MWKKIDSTKLYRLEDKLIKKINAHIDHTYLQDNEDNYFTPQDMRESMRNVVIGLTDKELENFSKIENQTILFSQLRKRIKE